MKDGLVSFHLSISTSNMPTYYFDLTNDIVIARNPMVAAAFYCSYYDYLTYRISLLETPDSEEPDKVATFSSHNDPPWQRASANIYLEPVGRHPDLPEGTVQQAVKGMRVSTSLFSDLIALAAYDCEYPKCGYDASDLYYDILLPLGEQILLLDEKQLGLLANAIRIRRDYCGDMVRSLRYLMDNYPSIYKNFIYPVIVENHEEAHLTAERQLLDRGLTGL
jgi:hypothetical protein